MKKLLVLFFSLIAFFAVVACDMGHKHEYGKEWKHDAISHWRECSCGAKDKEGEHKGGTATETRKANCSVCGQSYGEVVKKPTPEVTPTPEPTPTPMPTPTPTPGPGTPTPTPTPVVTTYNVTYQINGFGIQPENLTEVGALPATLPVLTAEGYEFEGWYTDSALTKAAVAGAQITENTTLYAKWICTIDLSNVKFEDKEFTADGAQKSLEVENLPSNCTVEYEGNGKTRKGTYVVTATIKGPHGEILTSLEAKMTIVKLNDGTYPYLKSIGINPNETHTAYQLLVYSFYDSDGDGYGDLAGVEQKLDYIADLGADMIWLSPVMAAGSYHGYDVLSFYAIDERLGTTEDFKSLVDSAHEMGIKIILDMPINHTSSEHEWFQGYLNDDPQYANYYQTYNPSINYGSNGYGTFYTDETTGKKYFGAFGETMPDLNFQSEELKQGVQEVFEYWIELGADGFRLDAIKHIYDPNEIPSNQNSVQLNNQYFADLRAHLKGINPYIYLVGENFSGQDEVKKYAQSFDAEFDFDSWQTGLGAVAGTGPWGGGEEKKIYFDDTIVGCTNELISLNPEWIPSYMTGNHDVNRAGSWIGDRVNDDQEALKLYAAMVTLRAGIPYIYYGDELGMYGENKHGNDKAKVGDAELRLPMTFSDSTVDILAIFTNEYDDGSIIGENILKDWPNFATDNPQVDDQIADPDSLLNTYKALIALRNEYKHLSLGTMSTVADYNNCATVIGFTYEGETIYVAYNFSEYSTTLEGVCDGTIELIHTVNGVTVNGTNLEMAGRGVAVFTATGTMGSGNSTGGIDLKGFSLRGTMTNWSYSTDYLFVAHDDDEVKITITLNAGDKFKVVQNNSATAGQEWWHGNGCVKQDCKMLTNSTDKDDNIIIKDSGTYTLYWDVDDFQLWINKDQ